MTNLPNPTTAVKLADINTTAGTQIRAKIDTDTVSEYADAMRDNIKFPPVVLYHDGSQYFVADGFHRIMAASRNGFLDILADVRKGTRADALRYALSANAAHGLKRTNADKRRSVELALQEWPKLSDREIARICAVSNQAVSNWRSELSTVDSSPEPATRIGKDGKGRKAPSQKNSIQFPVNKLIRELLIKLNPGEWMDRPTLECDWGMMVPPEYFARRHNKKGVFVLRDAVRRQLIITVGNLIRQGHIEKEDGLHGPQYRLTGKGRAAGVSCTGEPTTSPPRDDAEPPRVVAHTEVMKGHLGRDESAELVHKFRCELEEIGGRLEDIVNEGKTRLHYDSLMALAGELHNMAGALIHGADSFRRLADEQRIANRKKESAR